MHNYQKLLYQITFSVSWKKKNEKLLQKYEALRKVVSFFLEPMLNNFSFFKFIKRKCNFRVNKNLFKTLGYQIFFFFASNKLTNISGSSKCANAICACDSEVVNCWSRFEKPKIRIKCKKMSINRNHEPSSSFISALNRYVLLSNRPWLN